MPTQPSPGFTGIARAYNAPPGRGVANRVREKSPLAALRQSGGLTCAELSERSGVDLIIIMLAERGSDLLPEERAAIAAVLGVDAFMIGG
ncbi:MAG: hypothetical protein P0Y66_10900 [Candidatus Kaistia colombiensis]|nr:MAG: hypothetical protein P0Y66_10900 [Kaistia sp.]